MMPALQSDTHLARYAIPSPDVAQGQVGTGLDAIQHDVGADIGHPLDTRQHPQHRLRQHAQDLFDNPMGLMGFEFVEFASPTPGVLEPLFEKMGFTLVARHRSKDVVLYRQGDINFIVNREPRSLAGYFAAEHGPSACGLAFRVKDSHKAYALALERGAQPVDIPTGPMELRLPAIKGIGGAPLYLIDRFEDGKSHLRHRLRSSSTASTAIPRATA
jgi:4-hydroxyphenylpyruvate dioxygenase-like putative hemolysin